MPGSRFFPTFGMCAVFFLFAAPVHAECKDLRQFIKDETAGPDKYVDTFSFRKNHHADSVLMLVKNTVEKGHLPKRWLFLHRDDPNSNDLCVAARGVEFGQYDDDHERTVLKAFGPEGSGFPRCTTSTANLDAAEAVRIWANAELGHSIILYTASNDAPGYQFVIADNQDWIIIEDDKNPKQSCYFDRGTDLSMRFNTTIIQP